jgi:hypothetical protein
VFESPRAHQISLINIEYFMIHGRAALRALFLSYVGCMGPSGRELGHFAVAAGSVSPMQHERLD